MISRDELQRMLEQATPEQLRALEGQALTLGKDTAFAAEKAAEDIGELIRAGATLATVISVAEFEAAREAAVAKVIIRNPRTGHEAGIELRDFRTRKAARDRKGQPVTYEEAGYRIVSHMDGSPYQQPAPKAEG